MRWLSRLRGGTATLNGLEQAVVDAALLALPARTALLVRAQLRAVNLVQRHLAGREVNLYRMRARRPSHDPALAFSNRTDELQLAHVTLRLPGGAEAITARLICVRGYLFSLVFDRPPPPDRHVEILAVAVDGDPWKPAREAVRDGLPQEFLTFKSTPDVDAAGLEVLEPQAAYEVELEDGTHVVLAQFRGEGVLTLSPAGSPIQFVPFDAAEARRPYSSFAEAVDDLVRR